MDIININDNYKDERMDIVDRYKEEIIDLHQIDNQKIYDQEIIRLLDKITVETGSLSYPVILPLILSEDKDKSAIKKYYLKMGGTPDKIVSMINNALKSKIEAEKSIKAKIVTKEELEGVENNYQFEPEHHLKQIIKIEISAGKHTFHFTSIVYVHKKHDKLWSYQIRESNGQILVNVPCSKDSPKMLASKPRNNIFKRTAKHFSEPTSYEKVLKILEEKFIEIQDKIDNLNPKPDFSVEPNPLFIKKDTKFKCFLEKSHKVYLNPDLFFMAFQSKDKMIRLLCADNKSEQVEEYQVYTLTHLNKQSNLRAVIETELQEEHLEMIEQFQRYFLNSLKDHLLDNSVIFYEIFKQITDYSKPNGVKIINKIDLKK